MNQKNPGSWVARLSNDYVMLADVINRGFGGYNTNMFRQILEQLISQDLFTNVRAVTLFLGANDAQWHRHQSLPLEEYKVGVECLSSEPNMTDFKFRLT